ncbi:hypothetical protein [Gibbsiella quercinecans]|uniref:hypothetical protein n=1 Tax=Gibbsiella quercinecans TaxID=929813 RepID=UPI00242A950C|nr:hypothetical protein [Gibbsiella quercinecans]
MKNYVQPSRNSRPGAIRKFSAGKLYEVEGISTSTATGRQYARIFDDNGIHTVVPIDTPSRLLEAGGHFSNGSINFDVKFSHPIFEEALRRASNIKFETEDALRYVEGVGRSCLTTPQLTSVN